MAELKTKITEQPVQEYLMQIADETKRQDCLKICTLMESITNAPSKMWGTDIIGTGDYRYYYKSGKSGDWFMMGFSPRKTNISLYLFGCNLVEQQALLASLGKHKTGKGCIYIKTLADIDFDVLKTLCEISYQRLSTGTV